LKQDERACISHPCSPTDSTADSTAAPFPFHTRLTSSSTRVGGCHSGYRRARHDAPPVALDARGRRDARTGCARGLRRQPQRPVVLLDRRVQRVGPAREIRSSRALASRRCCCVERYEMCPVGLRLRGHEDSARPENGGNATTCVWGHSRASPPVLEPVDARVRAVFRAPRAFFGPASRRSRDPSLWFFSSPLGGQRLTPRPPPRTPPQATPPTSPRRAPTAARSPPR
jgi:hypothetical protein